jgi:hypothetical protein
MDKGALEVIGESIRIEGQYPLREIASHASVVYFINLKFHLNSVDKLMTLINVHGIV